MLGSTLLMIPSLMRISPRKKRFLSVIGIIVAFLISVFIQRILAQKVYEKQKRRRSAFPLFHKTTFDLLCRSDFHRFVNECDLLDFLVACEIPVDLCHDAFDFLLYLFLRLAGILIEIL